MRIEGWEQRLEQYFADSALKEFEYGTLDCVCFASDAVLLICGTDPMAEGRGKYKTLKKGAELIKKHRGSYVGIMDYYFKRIPTVKAQRGDVLMIIQDAQPAYGVMGSGGMVFFKTRDKGLAIRRCDQCVMAWRVE